jgi:hypothetical protein
LRLAVPRDERGHRSRRRIAQSEGRRIRGRSGQGRISRGGGHG